MIVGIYSIINKINNKLYIGSSSNITYRFKYHLCKLRNNKHSNKHLQAAWNKYGEESFEFKILEYCSKEKLINKEQSYIESKDWDILYNKTKIAYGGGSDLVTKPLYLLNLKGEIVEKFTSGSEIARFLGLSIIDYPSINTRRISKKQYRIVTPEYYMYNIKDILRWRKYSNLTKYKKEIRKFYIYKVYRDDKEYSFNSKLEVGNFLGIKEERVRQILMSDVKVHKKSGFAIASMEKIL